jgi:hypothetical protein
MSHGRIKFPYDCHRHFDADVKQSDIGFDSSVIGSLSALLKLEVRVNVLFFFMTKQHILAGAVASKSPLYPLLLFTGSTPNTRSKLSVS